MADKLRTQQLLEQLQARYVGTGHADTSTEEWKLTIKRDTATSVADHAPLLRLAAMAEGEPMGLARARILETLIRPIKKSKGPVVSYPAEGAEQ